MPRSRRGDRATEAELASVSPPDNTLGSTRERRVRELFRNRNDDIDYQRIASCKASRNWFRQSGIVIPNAARTLALQSTELRGLRAGVWNCSLVIPTTRLAFSGPPNSPVSAGQASSSS